MTTPGLVATHANDARYERGASLLLRDRGAKPPVPSSSGSKCAAADNRSTQTLSVSLVFLQHRR
jgi:hypothetical protein